MVIQQWTLYFAAYYWYFWGETLYCEGSPAVSTVRPRRLLLRHQGLDDRACQELLRCLQDQGQRGGPHELRVLDLRANRIGDRGAALRTTASYLEDAPFPRSECNSCLFFTVPRSVL